MNCKSFSNSECALANSAELGLFCGYFIVSFSLSKPTFKVWRMLRCYLY